MIMGNSIEIALDNSVLSDLRLLLGLIFTSDLMVWGANW